MIYNKGLQYGLTKKVLRFEKKHIKMSSLKWGPVYLIDLTRLDFAEHCLTKLIKSLDDLIINGDVKKELLSKNEYRIYEWSRNPLNWAQVEPKRRAKRKKRFNEIIAQHGEQKFMCALSDLLNKKKEELLESLV